MRMRFEVESSRAETRKASLLLSAYASGANQVAMVCHGWSAEEALGEAFCGIADDTVSVVIKLVM